MDENIFEYLDTQRVCVLAVEMPDGSPHAATVHFAYAKEPLEFVFKTERSYRKVEPLLEKDEVRASLVIGMQEEEMKTLQMDGIVSLTDHPEHINTYHGKFTDKNK